MRQIVALIAMFLGAYALLPVSLAGQIDHVPAGVEQYHGKKAPSGKKFFCVVRVKCYHGETLTWSTGTARARTRGNAVSNAKSTAIGNCRGRTESAWRADVDCRLVDE